MTRAWLLGAAVVGVAAMGLARADERVREQDVPKPVIDAVKKKYPESRLASFYKDTSGGKVVFEVYVRDESRSIEVDCSPEGKIVEEAERIDEETLPKEVRAALVLSKFGHWTVGRVHKVVKNEKADDPSYELVVADGERVFDVAFDRAGKITKEERRERPGSESLSWDTLEPTHKKYPKARIVRFEREHEKGELMVRLWLVEGTHDIGVVVSASTGKIVRERETIEVDSIPKEVKAGLDGSRYAGWNIVAAERVVIDEKAADPVYELVVSNRFRRAEVSLDKTGKVVPPVNPPPR